MTATSVRSNGTPPTYQGQHQPQSSENGSVKPQSPVNAATSPNLGVGIMTPAMQQGPPEDDRARDLKGAEARTISLSPPIGTDGKVSPSHSHTYSTSGVSDVASVDMNTTKDKTGASTEEVVGESTHGVKKDINEGSHIGFERVKSQKPGNGVPMRSRTVNRNAPAELDDTEEAHRRKVRLDSQEEKIHYNPDEDSDGEVPAQMSATSYPGQEWNPYGMPEYGEWNE